LGLELGITTIITCRTAHKKMRTQSIRVVVGLLIACFLVLGLGAESSYGKRSERVNSGVSFWKQANLNGQTIPSPRFDFGFDTFQDKSFSLMFGGTVSGFSVTDELWVLDHNNVGSHADPFSQAWSQIANNGQAWPKPTKDAAALFCNGDFYVIGGMTSKKQVLSDMWKYRVEEQTWVNLNSDASQTQRSIVSRAGHSAVCVQDMFIVLFGGVDGNGTYSNKIHTYGISDRVWIEMSPSNSVSVPPRMYSPLFFNPMQLAIYIFGGYATNSSGNVQNVNDMWTFSLYTREWRQINQAPNTPWPLARSGQNFAPMDPGHLLMFGGEGSDGMGLNDLWQYSFRNQIWTAIPSSGPSTPSGRLGSGLVQRYPNSPEYILFNGVSGWTNTTLLNDAWLCSLLNSN